MERKMMTFAVRTTIPHQQNVQLVVKVEEANHRIAMGARRRSWCPTKTDESKGWTSVCECCGDYCSPFMGSACQGTNG
jgi:hypothetical protein